MEKETIISILDGHDLILIFRFKKVSILLSFLRVGYQEPLDCSERPRRKIKKTVFLSVIPSYTQISLSLNQS